MTKLPVPYVFDVADIELRDDLEAMLQQHRKIERQAARSMAFEHQACANFRNQVMASREVSKDEVYVALLLSVIARLTPDGRLEVKEGLSKYAGRLKTSWSNKMHLAIEQLRMKGFIEILEHGSCSGHPYHIRIRIKQADTANIMRKAADELNRFLSPEWTSSTRWQALPDKSV
jgi:hypothetical protein